MLLSVGLNAIMSISFVIVLLFCIGDLDKTLSAPMPILELYYQATKSKAGATVLLLMAAFGIVVAMFNLTASVTRLTWAFARDHGLPFQSFFSQASRRATYTQCKAYLNRFIPLLRFLCKHSALCQSSLLSCLFSISALPWPTPR